MANLFIPKKYFKNSSNPFRQDFKTNKNEIFLSVNKKIVIIVCKFLKGTDLSPQRTCLLCLQLVLSSKSYRGVSLGEILA